MSRVITIAGYSASGKSSLAKSLGEYFQLRHVSVGEIYRGACSIKDLEKDKEIEAWDAKLDQLILENILQGGLVIEGRTVGYLGNKLKKEGLQDIMNIFLSCDPKIRLQRLIKRDAGSERTLKRDELDTQRFLKKYGINIGFPGLYDSVIDTGIISEKDTFLLAKKKIEEYWRL